MAWLGWLAGLPGGIATKAKNMDASAWASWVQAIGSIVAIVAGFGTVVYQNRHTDKSQEAQRRSRAEVVAYRLSGWIGEIGGRIERALRTCQERQSKASQGPPRVASDVIPEIRLGMVSGIDEVLPELHYLSSGSGDIAQLNHFANGYAAWLDRVYAEETRPGEVPQMMAEVSLREFYTRAETQLTAMKTLHANSMCHIAPLVAQAIEKGR